jgi:hypothetical protein
MSEKLRKIKDSASLFRDDSTSAVINKDGSGYESYIRTYEKLKNHQKEFEELKDDVKSLSSDISEIKSLLSTLIRREHNGN